MRKLLLWPLVLLTMSALWPVSVRADDEDPYGEYLLPPETLFMFSMPSVPDFVERAGGSSMGKFLNDPKMQPFLDDVRAKIEEGSKEVADHLGVTLGDLAELPSGEITFAVVGMPTRKLNAVLMIDCGEHEKTVATLLEKMDGGLKQMGGKLTTQSVGDVEIQIYTFPNEGDNPYKTLAYFNQDGYLAFGSDVSVLKAVIDRWTGKAKKSLADNEVFAYIQEQCSTDDEQEPAMKWYLDVMGLVRTGIGMVQGQNPQAGLVLGMLPILGLDGLKGVGGASDISVGDYDQVGAMFIYVEQPTSGVLGLFQFPAFEPTPPKWVPAESTMYANFNWNVVEAYAAAEALVDSFQGPGSLRKLIDGLAADENGPGVHIKKDLVDNLAGPIHVVTEEGEAEDGEPAIPEVTATILLKDAATMKKILKKAAASEGFPGEARELQGQTVYDLPIDGDRKVSVAVLGTSLVISTYAEGLETVLAGKTEDALADSDLYKEIAEFVPDKTSMFSISQQEGQIKTLWEMIRTQQNDSVPGLDLSKLPAFEDISKYLRPNVSFVLPDEKGALMMGFTLSDK